MTRESILEDLVERAAEHLCDDFPPPDDKWWKDYLTLKGGWWILTEAGWEEAREEIYAYHHKYDADWQPADEIGRPVAA